jgi:hypothetical protein
VIVRVPRDFDGPLGDAVSEVDAERPAEAVDDTLDSALAEFIDRVRECDGDVLGSHDGLQVSDLDGSLGVTSLDNVLLPEAVCVADTDGREADDERDVTADALTESDVTVEGERDEEALLLPTVLLR